ncbi:MAG: NAD(P)H-binding protein [Pseudomonadota bacterium]
MSDVLIVGATGQVGAQAVAFAQAKGHRVRAMVRSKDAVVHGATPEIVIGDLRDQASLRRALDGIDVVVATANAILPVGGTSTATALARDGYGALIAEAERAGVSQFVLASVPSHPLERVVPELGAKRLIETRLAASTMPWTIIRNPAFTDVWLVMAGAAEAASRHPHATTARPFGFLKAWRSLTGRVVSRFGVLVAPGGAGHGAPFITTEDVARMLVGVIGRADAYNRIVEAGGPAWVTWGEVARLMSARVGRRVRVVAMPAWLAAIGQAMLRPWPSASNVLGLVRFVAAYQPRWETPEAVAEFGLPPQISVSQYLDRTWGVP